MTKLDLATFVGIAEIANRAGLISIEAFQQVGASVAKANAAISVMGDADVMVIKKQKQIVQDIMPSESATPPGFVTVQLTSVDKDGTGTDFEIEEK